MIVINITLGGPIPKPSDMFYSKMIPALKERGITNLMSRKDWPHDVMRNVYLDLVKETPRYFPFLLYPIAIVTQFVRWILAKEVWCSSSSTAEWWRKTAIYNRSVATMSMIGYIIGSLYIYTASSCFLSALKIWLTILCH